MANITPVLGQLLPSWGRRDGLLVSGQNGKTVLGVAESNVLMSEFTSSCGREKSGGEGQAKVAPQTPDPGAAKEPIEERREAQLRWVLRIC